jgi:DNA-binding transcriptional MerR regulator
MTPRNVRAYQQRGLLPPPLRRGRNAWYSWDHLSRLRLVSALHEHGLTLKVIADLVDRGAADSELARLDRDELSATWAKTTRVPMAPGVAQWLREDAAEVLAQLMEYSVVEDRCGVIHANAAALGVAAALGARDIHPARTGRVALSAARAAQQVVADLLDEMDAVAERGPARQREVGLLFMQFAATCFADVLHSNLLESVPGQSDAAHAEQLADADA